MAGYGGETPSITTSFSLTVEAPTGTDSTTPVNEGDLFKLGGTAADGTGYKAVALASGNDSTSSVVVMAIHRIAEVGPMGVILLGPWHQVRRFNYVSGAAPTLGQSIEASGTNVRKIAGKAYDGDGYVLKVNTSDLTAEVLV